MKFESKTLGANGRSVFPIAVGGGYMPRSEALDMAYEAGVNYFFYAPTFPTYFFLARWLKNKFKTDREKIVLGTAPYNWTLPGSLGRIIDRHRKNLATDYIDYFHLGMVRKLDKAVFDALLKFKERGVIRHIAFSSHDRKLAARIIEEAPVELAMIRYNAAHRGAEREFFPNVDTSKIPVVAFNATRHKSLLKRPSGYTGNVPKVGDLYRFALTNPKVTMLLAGPSSVAHVKEFLDAVEKGPMNEDEMSWIREFGDRVYGKKAN